MSKKILELIEKKSGINKKLYPMDLCFLQVKKFDFGENQSGETKEFKENISIKAINYSGEQRLVPYAPLSLMTNPEKHISNDE